MRGLLRRWGWNLLRVTSGCSMNTSVLRFSFIVRMGGAKMAEVIDRDVITRAFTPKSDDQRLLEWANKMNQRDPLRVIANEERALGLVIKSLWRLRWSTLARPISAQHSSNDSPPNGGA